MHFFVSGTAFVFLQLTKLEETIRPLQGQIRELQSQRDALATDKTSILGEVDRWKNRTNQLIEQSHKTDPEEHKRLMYVMLSCILIMKMWKKIYVDISKLRILNFKKTISNCRQ